MDLDNLPDLDHYLLVKRINSCMSIFINRRILKKSEIQKSLLKEKLSHDIKTVLTDILITIYGYT